MGCRCKERRAAIQRAVAKPKTAKIEMQFVLRTAREDAGRSWRDRQKRRVKA